MRRRLALALMPALMITGAAPAAAAPPDPAESGGVTIHKVGPVLQYGFTEAVDGDWAESGMVSVSYTCRPGDDWPEIVALFVHLETADSVFQSSRFGEDVPCDGKRHRVDVLVDRRSGEPFTTGQKSVTATSRASIWRCVGDCEDDVTRFTAPVKINFKTL